MALVALTVSLAACAGNSGKAPLLPGEARPFTGSTGSPGPVVTPPATSTPYYYAYATTSSTQTNVRMERPSTTSSGGIATLKWSNPGSGQMTLVVTLKSRPSVFQWEESVAPFFLPGNYGFTASNGKLAETFLGYDYDVKNVGNYIEVSQSATLTPQKTIARFPLITGTTYNNAVDVAEGYSYYSYAHARSGGYWNSTLYAGGAYDFRQRDWHDNRYTVISRTDHLAYDGTGNSRRCNGNLSFGHCVLHAWGSPQVVSGSSVIPVTSKTTPFKAGQPKAVLVPNWYPNGIVPRPLLRDTVSVANATAPAACGTYESQMGQATIETIVALDPIAGTYSTETNTAYYLPANAMPFCGVASKTVQFFDNLASGKLMRTVSTSTSVFMTTAPTPSPSPTPLTTQTMYVGVGNNAYPTGHVYVYNNVRTKATPNATIEADTTGTSISLRDLAVDSSGTLYTQYGSAPSGATTLSGPPLLPSSDWILQNDVVYEVTGLPSISYFPLADGACVSACTTIVGSNTKLSANVALAVDASGEIWESDGNAQAFLRFAAGASGNVAPAQIIRGSDIGVTSAESMLVDGRGQLWYTYLKSGVPTLGIIFAPTSGNTSREDMQLWGTPGQLAIDQNDHIYLPLCGPTACIVQVFSNSYQTLFSINVPIGLADVAQSVAFGPAPPAARPHVKNKR